MLITYEITEDQDLQQQYYAIREQCFRRDLGITDFDGSRCNEDDNGHLFIARHGDRCIGGMRISGSGTDCSGRIPLEHLGLNVRAMFPELRLGTKNYCQWERLALLPSYRRLGIVREACEALIDFCIQMGYRFAFNVAGSAHARLYRLLHQSLGYTYRICHSVTPDKAFAGLEHLLSVACLERGTASFASAATPGFSLEHTGFAEYKMDPYTKVIGSKVA